MRKTDGRWSTKLLLWVSLEGYRTVGHTTRGWTDDIESYLKIEGKSWAQLAVDPKAWEDLVDDFAKRRSL